MKLSFHFRWYDFWVGFYYDRYNHILYICLLPCFVIKIELPFEDPEANSWLCECGNYITNGLHCFICGRQPPWGCPCSQCQDSEDDDQDKNEDRAWEEYQDEIREEFLTTDAVDESEE